MRVAQPLSLTVLLVRVETGQGRGRRSTNHVNSITHRAPGYTEHLDTISEVPEDDKPLVSQPDWRERSTY